MNNHPSNNATLKERKAFEKALNEAGSAGYLAPSEMFRIPTEREEPMMLLKYNHFIDLMWKLLDDARPEEKHQTKAITNQEALNKIDNTLTQIAEYLKNCRQ